jgi:DNA-binding NarL/FixJ family response regulator
MGDKSQIRLLIVDDHPLFRAGLEQIMEYEDHITIVGQSENGERAIEDTRRLAPDVILLDVNLPGGMNGLQVARKIRTERPNVPIIILTAYHDIEQVVHAISVGASSYCPKDIKPETLIKIIETVRQGYFVIEQMRMNKGQRDKWLEEQIRQLSGPYTIDGDEHYSPLSPRETEILKHVTQGMSNKEIAYKLGISQQTVKNHMTSILKKLNVDDRTQAAITAIRSGWVRIESRSKDE